MFQNMSNPDNLPIIDEPSLHRLVKRVQNWKNTADHPKIGLKYQDEEFNLVQDATTGDFLPISKYLYFDDVQNEIKSQNSFYWKEWSFEKDIKKDEYGEPINYLDLCVNNFTEIKLFEKLTSEKIQKYMLTPRETEEGNILPVPFIDYNFHIRFSSGVTIGKLLNPFSLDESNPGRVLFGNLHLDKLKFEETVSFSHCIFKGIFTDFSETQFCGPAYFNNSFFEIDCDFSKASFEETASFKNVVFFEDTKVNFTGTSFKEDLNFNEVNSSNNDHIIQFIQSDFGRKK